MMQITDELYFQDSEVVSLEWNTHGCQIEIFYSISIMKIWENFQQRLRFFTILLLKFFDKSSLLGEL